MHRQKVVARYYSYSQFFSDLGILHFSFSPPLLSDGNSDRHASRDEEHSSDDDHTKAHHDCCAILAQKGKKRLIFGFRSGDVYAECLCRAVCDVTKGLLSRAKLGVYFLNPTSHARARIGARAEERGWDCRHRLQRNGKRSNTLRDMHSPERVCRESREAMMESSVSFDLCRGYKRFAL